MRSSLEGCEVLGQGMMSFVDGLQQSTTLVSNILLSEGLGSMGSDGRIRIEPQAWYPLKAGLNALKQLGDLVGSAVHYQIGLRVPGNLVFPPSVRDVHEAIQAIGAAYLMNHRCEGQTLVGACSRGQGRCDLGGYGCERVMGRNEIVTICDNPYPCDFDRGLLTATARRFQPHAWVFHDDTRPCRKHGGASCTYRIKWV